MSREARSKISYPSPVKESLFWRCVSIMALSKLTSRTTVCLNVSTSCLAATSKVGKREQTAGRSIEAASNFKSATGSIPKSRVGLVQAQGQEEAKEARQEGEERLGPPPGVHSRLHDDQRHRQRRAACSSKDGELKIRDYRLKHATSHLRICFSWREEKQKRSRTGRVAENGEQRGCLPM